ncbi:MAG: RNA methyltransferase, partial [Parvibaculum sp.]|nr:RNA methyltransferase [Parvibaculum sp.]
VRDQGPGLKLKPLTTERRDLFRRPLLASELDKYDAVVLDPPRAGAQAQAAELAKSRVPRIAFVSCSPASFARDARMLLDGGYRLVSVTPVDQFLWSAHVELIGVFSRD